jgi:hypothetical protein
MLHRIYYWAEAFRDPTVENRDVAVRYDPFDIGTAYAFVRNRWTECHSEHYVMLQDRSEKEVLLASKEIRRRKQLHSRERFTLTARKLADFLGAADTEEKCLIQRLRDKESRSIRQSGTAVVSSSSFQMESPPESTEQVIATPLPAKATAVYGGF